MIKVLVADALATEGLEILRQAPELQVDVKLKLSPVELKRILPEYHGLVVRSSTKVTAGLLEAASNLRVIGRAGVGVDNVDVEDASKRGIVVMNTPGGNNVTTAEHALSLMLSLARHIPQATASLKGGKWERQQFIGTELCNKTLGIIGLGNVGSIVADRALGLKMKVIACDPYLSSEAASRLRVELVSLDELFHRADFISVHSPLIPETRDLINRTQFQKMKKGVRIVNCARGGIVNEQDLIEAIKAKIVQGAAFDVFEEEPPPSNHPFFERDEIICTPHLGASTDEAQLNVAIAIAEQMVDFLCRGVIRTAVNVPSLPPEMLQVLGPHLSLAEKLGRLQAQMLTSAPTEVHLTYAGEIASLDASAVTLAALKGLLSYHMESNVNYVNAPVIARERGIRVVESRSSRSTDFISSVTLRVKTSKDESEVEGAVFGKKTLRIVKINNFYMEAVPEGYILMLHNQDVPGVVGAIGTHLGKRGINIAGLELGREKVGGMALSLIHVDNHVPREILEELRELPNIVTVDLLQL
jgi:D-3-phosphoglycerate dehydrogenase